MKNRKLEEKFLEWKSKNGACDINWDEDNIWLYNGGLFQDMNEDHAELWIGDLNESIRYLKRLKNFLNKNGIDTGRDYSDIVLKRKKLRRCIDCNKPLRLPKTNKSGYCTNCLTRRSVKEWYDKKKESKQKKT